MLSTSIRDVQGMGQQPNDLRDERDKLLTDLASFINIDAYETDSRSVLVSVGGKQLKPQGETSP